MNKVDIAKSKFSEGYNCAQSVLIAFANEAGIDEITAKKIALGFGAGMGRLQNTCGAVTGAYMVISLIHSEKTGIELLSSEKVYQLIQEFTKEFIEINSSTNCREILAYDINTEEGRAEAKENNYFITKCQKYIEDSIKLLDEKYIKKSSD